ncbi:hypothetical protein GCK72_007652 [Caenorhabditis remanei]|uniref:ribonuclease H n=1 Tax=Caenorhabditis remanei TaxID=31234 RepID=A0A6A5HMV4_CAERE|nr:hypothetical protein GCK72_007652 [Caenorhabditis remanei]KAF1767693.1 hypothetical protein GCK72_007652 [Caenorhabditis remanei]
MTIPRLKIPTPRVSSYRTAHSLKQAVHHTRSIQKSLNYTGGRAVAYTDGWCLNEGRRNAKAGFGVFWYPGCAYNFCGNMTGKQDSHRAELCAVSTAILMAYLLNKPGITIKTDCKFVITSYKMPKEWRRRVTLSCDSLSIDI